MALEKRDATQLCSWAPPLPQRAFPIQAAGVTSDNIGGNSLGGTAVNGQKYGYFLLNTSQWAVSPNLNLPPVQAGERFQLCTSVNGTSFPQPPGYATGKAVPQAAIVTGSTVVIQVPDGAGGWLTVSFPSYAAFNTFFTDLGGANGYYPNGLTTAQILAAIGAVGGTIGSQAVTVQVPDGTGGWLAVSFPSQPDFQSFFTDVGGANGFYPNGLTTAQILTAVAQNNGTVITQTSTNGSPASAPDLFNVSMMFPGLYSVKDPTLCSVVSTSQAGANSWYVYYSPYNPAIAARPGADGLVTVPELSSPKWLGQVGHVANLDYTYSIPGGPDQLTCLLQVEPNYRTEAVNPGRVITAHRGGSCIWEGTLTEPSPAPTGWTLTANGCGTYGSSFGAWWEIDFPASWSVDGPVDLAIGRGLRWSNPGLNNPGGAAYLGPVQNPGSLTVTDFMNLLCTGGALSWQLVPPPSASSFPPGPWIIDLFPLPTDVSGNPAQSAPSSVLASELYAFNRWSRTDLSSTLSRQPPDLYIINTNPMGRTITADINTVIVYYQVSADAPATSTAPAVAATYSTVFADIPGSVSRHGRLEYYLDVSSAGTLTQPQAMQIAQNVLSKYVRANFSGTFPVMPGQLLNVGGFPVDLGCNWGGYLASVQVENFAAGGEVGFAPITFQIGEYEFNDDTQTASITPYQNARTDMSSVIAQLYPGKFT